jgi:hypothetical protein
MSLKLKDFSQMEELGAEFMNPKEHLEWIFI